MGMKVKLNGEIVDLIAKFEVFNSEIGKKIIIL
jgi:hypothetical protein